MSGIAVRTIPSDGNGCHGNHEQVRLVGVFASEDCLWSPTESYIWIARGSFPVFSGLSAAVSARAARALRNASRRINWTTTIETSGILTNTAPFGPVGLSSEATTAIDELLNGCEIVPWMQLNQPVARNRDSGGQNQPGERHDPH